MKRCIVAIAWLVGCGGSTGGGDLFGVDGGRDSATDTDASASSSSAPDAPIEASVVPPDAGTQSDCNMNDPTLAERYNAEYAAKQFGPSNCYITHDCGDPQWCCIGGYSCVAR